MSLSEEGGPETRIVSYKSMTFTVDGLRSTVYGLRSTIYYRNRRQVCQAEASCITVFYEEQSNIE